MSTTCKGPSIQPTTAAGSDSKTGPTQKQPSRAIEPWLDSDPSWIVKAITKRLTEIETLLNLLLDAQKRANHPPILVKEKGHEQA